MPAFANPATQALMPNLVPQGPLSRGGLFNASAWQSSSIVGPAVGGFLYALGPSVVFGPSTSASRRRRCSSSTVTVPRAGGRGPRAADAGRPCSAGVSFIRSRPVILGAISLDLFAVLLGGAVALLPIYAKDILQVGPWGLGLLRSMPATGRDLLDAAAGLVSRAATGPGCACSPAVAVFGVGHHRLRPLDQPLRLDGGALRRRRRRTWSSVVVRQTLVQLETPDEMRGRVSAVNSVFIGASNELGEFESGLAAAAIGPVGAVGARRRRHDRRGGAVDPPFPALWKRDTSAEAQAALPTPTRARPRCSPGTSIVARSKARGRRRGPARSAARISSASAINSVRRLAAAFQQADGVGADLRQPVALVENAHAAAHGALGA